MKAQNGQRTPIVGGNWKMNLHRQEAAALAGTLARHVVEQGQVEVVVFPPFPYLQLVRDVLDQTPAEGGPKVVIKLGAQDCFHQPNGAFTGEVSLSMLRDIGVTVVLVGHSERRHIIGEDDQLVNRKVRAALDAGFEVVLCVGEKLEQRELAQTHAVNAAQIHYGLAGVDRGQMAHVTIAYEPVWAIGTGKTATPGDAQSAHHAIRQTLATIYDPQVAGAVRIQYGGSMKPANAAQLMGQADIDGGLIGGASLDADAFTAVIAAAGSSVGVAGRAGVCGTS